MARLYPPLTYPDAIFSKLLPPENEKYPKKLLVAVLASSFTPLPDRMAVGKAPNTPITQASERVHTVQPQVAAREFDEHRRPRQTTISQGGHSSGNLSAIEVGRDQ